MTPAAVSAATTGLLVTVLVASALGPWWLAGRVVRRRALAVAVAVGVGSASGSGGRGGRAGHEVDGASVELVVVLAMLGAACRTGAALPRALGAVGAAIGGEDGELLARAGRALVLGASWSDAWAGPTAGGRGVVGRTVHGPSRRGRRPGGRSSGGGSATERWEVVRDALAPTWERGAPPGPALAAAADAERRDARTRAATSAGRLGVRLVLPLGTCYLPAFVLVGLVPVLVSYGTGLLGR